MAMTRQRGGGCRHTADWQIRRPAPLLCLDDAKVVFVIVVVNDNDNNNGIPPSTLPEAAAAAAAAVVDVFVVIHILGGCRPRRGGRTT